MPRLFLAVSWFGLALAVESSIIPLDPVFEHRLYVPMFAFAVLLAAALPRGSTGRYRVAAWSLAGLVLVLLMGLTIRRNAVWADPVKLYETDARHTVGSYRPGMMLADTYYQQGKYELAQQEYDKVFSRFDESNLDCIPPKALINMAIAYGRFHDVARAETLLRAAKRAAPRSSEACYNLGISLFLQDRHAEAFQEFTLARKYAPGNVKVLYYYILLSATHGDRDEALRLLDEMRRLDPDYARQLEERLETKPAQGDAR